MDILPCLKGQVKILGFFFSEEEKIKEFFWMFGRRCYLAKDGTFFYQFCIHL